MAKKHSLVERVFHQGLSTAQANTTAKKKFQKSSNKGRCQNKGSKM